eukprot:6161684-Heterocapsa_arctica.AAC.1
MKLPPHNIASQTENYSGTSHAQQLVDREVELEGQHILREDVALVALRHPVHEDEAWLAANELLMRRPKRDALCEPEVPQRGRVTLRVIIISPCSDGLQLFVLHVWLKQLPAGGPRGLRG